MDHAYSPRPSTSDKHAAAITRLDLSSWPPLFVSSTHFSPDELRDLEDDLVDAGATVTHDIAQAKLVLSKATRKARILFDLRAQGLSIQLIPEPDLASDVPNPLGLTQDVTAGSKRKRQSFEALGNERSDPIPIDDSSTESEPNSVLSGTLSIKRDRSSTATGEDLRGAASDVESLTKPDGNSIVQVLRVDWFTDSVKLGSAQSIEKYISFKGVRHQNKTQLEHCIVSPASAKQTLSLASLPWPVKKPVSNTAGSILKRAKEDSPKSTSKWASFQSRQLGRGASSPEMASWQGGQTSPSRYAHLLHRTTTEHDDGFSSELPEMPDWVKERVRYSCLRATPKDSPNRAFITLLKEIQKARSLTNDEIGVRAYATSIASIAAYPHKIASPREILALPGCDVKIANLFVEWANTGTLQAVKDIAVNEDLQVLRLFYDIWGVGARTAREFYYDRGWRDLDDIVEFGWSGLTRVQQIGVKYYDEFQQAIPRAEVAAIARVIAAHAVRVRDGAIQTMLVGGYRRGKAECGDVDVLVSHPDETQTLHLVSDLVSSLEEEEWITHTLLLSLHNSHRDQQTLPFRGVRSGHGFDTLDKALVVWQDPAWPTKAHDLAEDAQAKNPNIHRRVDIIVSPWRTVGCAVVGWTGGTTFERDLRWYARSRRGWKFDSSGVRDRANGEVVDLEGYSSAGTRAETMEEAEKRVFAGMDIPYREPWERGTG